ncbi:MAG: EthD domain-containing protein [Acidimicrobiales bacterium]
MIKLIFCVRRRHGLTHDEFLEWWRATHAQVVVSRAEALGIRRYVQLHTMETPVNEVLRGSRGAPEPFDGIAEVWFESLDQMTSAMNRSEARDAARAVLEDEARFIDHARSPIFLADEHVVID